MGAKQRTDPETTRRLCVVLHPQGENPDSGLVRALGRRDMQVVACDDAHESFARVCNDAKTGRSCILVLDGEEPRSMGDRLMDAMERFAPAGVCWEHAPGANPPIRPVVGTLGGAIDRAIEPAPAPEPVEPAPFIEPAGPSPALRLAPAPEQSPKPSPGGHVSAKDVLNADELDALLASELPKKNGD